MNSAMSDFFWQKSSGNQLMTINETNSGRKSCKDCSGGPCTTSYLVHIDKLRPSKTNCSGLLFLAFLLYSSSLKTVEKRLPMDPRVYSLQSPPRSGILNWSFNLNNSYNWAFVAPSESNIFKHCGCLVTRHLYFSYFNWRKRSYRR